MTAPTPDLPPLTDDQLETLAGKAGMYTDLLHMGAASIVYSPGCLGVNLTELKRFAELLDADRAAGRAQVAPSEPVLIKLDVVDAQVPLPQPAETGERK